MTESLKILQDTRMAKTAIEVEEEFKILQHKKEQERMQQMGLKSNNASKKSYSKAAPLYEYDADQNEDE